MGRKVWTLLVPTLLLIVTLVIPAGASPLPAGDGPKIFLARASFDPLAGAPGLNSTLAGADQPAAGNTVFLLQFDGPVQDEWKAAAQAAGVQLLGYVPDYAFLVRLKGLSPDAAGALPHVRWVGPYQKGFKLAQSLDAAGAPAQPATVTVSLFPGEDRAGAEAAIRARGGTIVDEAVSALVGDALRVTLPAGRVAELADVPEVAWVEPFLPMELANNRARAIMNVNSAWAAMAGRGVSLYGAGQVVDVTDTGLDTGNLATLSQDFANRVTATVAQGRVNNWSDGTASGGHGTHVAGSVLGSGRSSGSNPATHDYDTYYAGVAPEASLVMQSVMDGSGGLTGIPTDLKQLFVPAHNLGARIHTNSWGSPTGNEPSYGGYTASSRYADEFMWLYPTSLLLFAAGNEGVDANSNGVIDLDRILSPGTAKNVLTVGATENNRPPSDGAGGYTQDPWGSDSWAALYPAEPIYSDYISDHPNGVAAFSSRGPTDDGRIKPEIVAPGTDIISTRSHAAGAGIGWGAFSPDYMYDGGTSMATPLTAGAATLVRQFYTDVRHDSNPSAALLKATLINGALNITPGQYGTGAAREIPAAAPNNVIGFGRVDLRSSLALNAGEGLAFWDTTPGLGTGGARTYNVTVTAAGGAGSQIAATLAWTDFPGTVGAGKALVNDLDLEVVGPTGTHYKGNGATIWDHLNNTERVQIDVPAGTYQLIVRGYNVPTGPQPYALVVSGENVAESAGTPRTWLPLIVKQYPVPVATATRTATPRPPTPTATRTPGGQPGTTTLTAIADAYVMEGLPSVNRGSELYMHAGYDDDPNYLELTVRSLLKFNVAGAVPAGATISSAKLRVYYEGYYDWADHVSRVTAYRASGNWTEAGVTWANQPAIGSGYGYVDLLASNTAWGWYDIDVTALVQGWVAGSIPNQGLYLLGPEISGNDSSYREFSTREGGGPPQLVIGYNGLAGAPEPAGTPGPTAAPVDHAGKVKERRRAE